MSELVSINLFGELGEFVGSSSWEFCVKSVSEGLNALNTVTKNKFSDYFIKKNKLQAKYRVLINGRDFACEHGELNENNWQKFTESELVMKKKDLKTIDIVPLIESAGSSVGGIISAILGVILIIVGVVIGIFFPGIGWGVGGALIAAGLTLLGAGVFALLSKPPSFNFNQNLDTAAGQSYLFSGPSNTVGEGNPVPIGYGTMLVGSNVISAGYKISYFQATIK